MAMLLAAPGLLEGARLLGTDCRADAIAQARRGWFDPIRLESLDERFRQAYFVPSSRVGRFATHCGEQRSGSRAMPCRASRWAAFLGLDPLPQRGDLLGTDSCSQTLDRTCGIAALRWNLGSRESRRPQQQLSLLRLAPCVFEKRR